MSKDQREIARKLGILQHAEETGHVAKTCRYFGVGCSRFCRWREAYRKHSDVGLVNRSPISKWHANRTPIEIEEKVLHLRSKYHLGPMRIVWYLERYHGIKISDATVSRMLKRNGVNRLPRGTRLRKVHTKRYNKQVLGHHIQMDVKFLKFKGKRGQKIRRFQFTAIDDATRVRALKIHEKHTQASAIDFVDHIIEKFPFRIREIRTDNGHEFQAKFHWHVEDQGIRHTYIRRGTPQLNGKVERSHRSDSQEFYQLLSYKGDVDLEAKLNGWERFINFARPHGAFNGKTPYEALREKL
ncbi:MAG: IS481 family transposase [Hyphomicrobiales bacterium]|nr:IS481 family transposase [Hyphomicrobiales bacterium]